MRRGLFFFIVALCGVMAVLTILFFIFDNPYRRLNPAPEAPVDQSADENALPPLAVDADSTELLTVWLGKVVGMSTGVDGLRLVFYDADKSKIAVTEFDGTGYQELSDTLLGVEDMALSPTKEKAWLRLVDPEAKEIVTLVYDFRAKEAARLENGIQAIDWSPDGSELLYYVERAGAAPALKIVSANGVEPRTIRDGFSVQGPVLDWYGESQIAYWLKPSSTRPSSIITMSTAAENATELTESAPSQQALFSPDGRFVLVSQNNPQTGKPELSLGTTADQSFAALPLTTWVDKCTWMDDSARLLCFVPRDLPGGFTYPEDNDGSLTYRDQLWVVDAATAKPQLIYDVPASITDATQPFAAGNGSRLNFLSRGSSTIISLDIEDKLVAPTTPDVTTQPIDNTVNTSNTPATGTTSTDNSSQD